MTIFAEAASSLNSALQSVAGEPIVCRRGAESVELTAIAGHTTFTVETTDFGVEQVESHDFIVLADSYRFDGVVTLPRRGDRIMRTVGLRQLHYEVMPHPGMQPYRYSDTDRTILRIHTKQVHGGIS